MGRPTIYGQAIRSDEWHNLGLSHTIHVIDIVHQTFIGFDPDYEQKLG